MGARNEARGATGIAHFLEHMMFKGTPTVGPREFARIVEQNGGRNNAFTTHDVTSYFVNIAADKLQLLYTGMAESLQIAILATVIGVLLSVPLGLAAARNLAPAPVAWTARLLVVAFRTFHPVIIAILSPMFRGETWLIFVVLLAAFQWMVTARIVRGMTLSLKEREFVQAARFMGVPGWRIIFRHILPNMSSLLIIDATVNVSSLILAEVGLSFFGFGVQPPDVSLGTLIGNYAGAALTYPWEFYFPAGFLVALVLAINVVGDGLRDAFDPNAGSGTRS